MREALLNDIVVLTLTLRCKNGKRPARGPIEQTIMFLIFIYELTLTLSTQSKVCVFDLVQLEDDKSV